MKNGASLVIVVPTLSSPYKSIWAPPLHDEQLFLVGYLGIELLAVPVRTGLAADDDQLRLGQQGLGEIEGIERYPSGSDAP